MRSPASQGETSGNTDPNMRLLVEVKVKVVTMNTHIDRLQQLCPAHEVVPVRTRSAGVEEASVKMEIESSPSSGIHLPQQLSALQTQAKRKRSILYQFSRLYPSYDHSSGLHRDGEPNLHDSFPWERRTPGVIASSLSGKISRSFRLTQPRTFSLQSSNKLGIRSGQDGATITRPCGPGIQSSSSLASFGARRGDRYTYLLFTSLVRLPRPRDTSLFISKTQVDWTATNNVQV